MHLADIWKVNADVPRRMAKRMVKIAFEYVRNRGAIGEPEPFD